MISNSSPSWTVASTRSAMRIGLFSAALATLSALILAALSESLASWDIISVAAVVISLIVALYLARATPTASENPTRKCFGSALVIWMFLLLSEELFSRSGGDLQSVLQGQFSVAAYGEFSLWAVAFLALLVISLKTPEYFRYMFSKRYRWVSVLTVLFVLSTALSPGPLYSLVWAFKLCLVVVLLAMCSALIRDASDL